MQANIRKRGPIMSKNIFMKILKGVLVLMIIGCLFFILRDRVSKHSVIDVIDARNFSFEKCSVVHPEYGTKMLSDNEISDLKECLTTEKCSYNGSTKGLQVTVYDGTLFHVFFYKEDNTLEGTINVSDTGKLYVNHKEYVLSNEDTSLLDFLKEVVE